MLGPEKLSTKVGGTRPAYNDRTIVDLKLGIRDCCADANSAAEIVLVAERVDSEVGPRRTSYTSVNAVVGGPAGGKSPYTVVGRGVPAL